MSSDPSVDDIVERECAIEDCDLPVAGMGWCNKHYHRYRLHGDPLGGGPVRSNYVRRPAIERFVEKLEIDPESGCWLWTGTRDKRNYGRFFFDGARGLAHRASYELLIGPIPNGLVLDHLCKNPPCVNPDHLEPVTQRENMRRIITGICSRGHVIAGDNVRQRKNGYQECRTCAIDRCREWRERKKAVA